MDVVAQAASSAAAAAASPPMAASLTSNAASTSPPPGMIHAWISHNTKNKILGFRRIFDHCSFSLVLNATSI